MKEVCGLCCPPEEYQDLDIAEFEFWKVSLHKNQVYLGRNLIVLGRHTEDIFDATDQEKQELNRIVKLLKRDVREAFGATLFNYAALGNTEAHAHLHFIPRYSSPVVFDGITFEDKNQGGNYAPYDRNFLVPKPVMLAIRNTIKDKLEIR